jgi:catechol 2,3-dioxygenase-like lactoylglutathione lyase family enzyme
MDDKPRVVECIVPILSVRDLAASIEFYVDVLGFQRDWVHQTSRYAIAGVSRDNCSIRCWSGKRSSSRSTS